ncbi:MAG TPA: phage tail protein [Candidatus Angelobacter sp.]
MKLHTFPQLFLAAATFAGQLGQIAHAQQPTPAPSPSDRAANTAKPRFDPYKNYRFRVAAGTQGPYVAGFSQMARVAAVDGEPTGRPGAEKLTGRGTYEAITLERGVTHDNTFAQWANQTQEPQQLRTLTLDIFNETGQLSSSRTLIGCVVNGIQSSPNLDDAGAVNNIAIERMQLRCRFDAIVRPVRIRKLPE